MRKLPVFFVIDVSESMAGPAHETVSTGMGEIVRTLRTDPQALETAQVSIIVFAGRAKVLTPMMELAHFYPPELPIGGGTNLGAALTELMDEIDTQVVRGSATRKGDWKPIVFLMTDGYPTDRPDAAIDRWNRDFAKRAQLVAVSIGGGADHKLLRRLTDDVIVLHDASPDSFKRFFNWISQSIAVQSRAVTEPAAKGGIDLGKSMPDGTAALDDAPDTGIDDRLAVFVARCQHSEAPYLMRFEQGRGGRGSSGRAGAPDTGGRYVLRQTIALKQSYFDLSTDEGAPVGQVSTADLAGAPGCPHCGTRIGMVSCQCGRLHCIDGEGLAICPWCGRESEFVRAAQGASFDIPRNAG